MSKGEFFSYIDGSEIPLEWDVSRHVRSSMDIDQLDVVNGLLSRSYDDSYFGTGREELLFNEDGKVIESFGAMGSNRRRTIALHRTVYESEYSLFNSGLLRVLFKRSHSIASALGEDIIRDYFAITAYDLLEDSDEFKLRGGNLGTQFHPLLPGKLSPEIIFERKESGDTWQLKLNRRLGEVQEWTEELRGKDGEVALHVAHENGSEYDVYLEETQNGLWITQVDSASKRGKELEVPFAIPSIVELNKIFRSGLPYVKDAFGMYNIPWTKAGENIGVRLWFPNPPQKDEEEVI